MLDLRVAVVTVAYASSDQLGGFLASVREDGAQVCAILVADNPSADSEETARIAAEYGARLVTMPSNLGYGGAVNAAVLHLASDVDAILVSNPDVRLSAGAIGRLARTLQENPGVGATGPRILGLDGATYPSARDVPSLRTGIGHAVFGRAWPNNPWTRRYQQKDSATDAPRDAGWLSGACLLVRRSAFEQVGGFDERYFMYFEDVDLGYRLTRAGWTNRYEPRAAVQHAGATSTSASPSRMLRVHHESAKKFLASKYQGWWLAPLRWVLSASLSARGWWLTRGEPSGQDS